MSIIISILASLAAFAGGSVALRFKDKLHIILGLSAGAVIGAALFDLIPESIELGAGYFQPAYMTTLTAIGFLAYLILDRTFSFHSHGHNHIEDIHGDDKLARSHESISGGLGAASFCLHSLIDGIAIGLAFQASSTVGLVVSIAVVAHRFSDGINTVGVILRHKGDDGSAWIWLSVVAISPIIGTMLTFVFSVTDQVLASILAIFAGFFLYIGASDLIPEGHHSHSKTLTTFMTIVGAIILYVIVHIVRI